MGSIKDRLFIDESGPISLSQYSKRYCVFGYVYCKDPSELRKRLRRYLKKIHNKGQYPVHLQELKFNLPYSNLINEHNYTKENLDSNFSIYMPEIRSRTLKIINSFSDGIFAAIIDKKTIKSEEWVQEELCNYVITHSLFIHILNKIRPYRMPIITFDRGRLGPSKFQQFGSNLVNIGIHMKHHKWNEYSGNLSPPVETSSIPESGIWAADFVAGAFFHKYSNNEWSYANFLNSNKIGV